jgi:hypothetical protein
VTGQRRHRVVERLNWDNAWVLGHFWSQYSLSGQKYTYSACLGEHWDSFRPNTMEQPCPEEPNMTLKRQC